MELQSAKLRARVKRRQTYRRLTIIGVVAAIILVLVVGFYYAYTASTAIDSLIGRPVSSADIASLKQLSLSPYGPAGTSMLSSIKDYTGTPLTSGGKPLVVYIGADYCPFCAVQRWSIILSLMRFGNFSNLLYMASSPSEGDYPTFTFYGSTYTSKYVTFQAFEAQDRNSQPLQTVPSNYSSIWSSYGSGFPFMDFGNRYIVPTAMLYPNALGGKNWTQVMGDIRTGDTIGTQIKESANVITALICKLTGNQPTSVCNQSPINGLTISIASYSPGSLGLVPQTGTPSQTASPAVTAARIQYT